ncbi:MAG: hypothetical protein IPN81_00935 [Nitrosomonadales bacterium]|nr:hypothetical protein [Nitrosomonadales bacterium]
MQIPHQSPQALTKDEIVLVYCDHAPDDNFQNDFLFLSPNIFDYAYKATIPLLFLGAALAYDGIIEIEFVEATHPIPASAEELVVVMEEFRLFVAQRMDERISFKKITIVGVIIAGKTILLLIPSIGRDKPLCSVLAIARNPSPR